MAKSNDAQPNERPIEGDEQETDFFNPNACAEQVDLSFLQPSDRPDSLGRLGSYEILTIIGRGGFGIVFRAFDEVLQRIVAIKMLSPQMAVTSPARKRFLREARAAAQVRHENVVQIFAVEEKPFPFLVMEYIPGESLQDRLIRTGPFSAAEIAEIGLQIAHGLAAAHAAKLIHRDIKPANVLIEEGQNLRVKITDFGLARTADDATLTQSGSVVGTPLYMSPEQASGKALDYRSDLFSLGSVLYAITAGHPPFRAETTLAIMKRVNEDSPRPIQQLIPETPEWLCNVITRLMEKDPARRFPSAIAACEALEGKALPLANTQKLTGRRWISVGIGLVICLAISAWIVFSTYPIFVQGTANSKSQNDFQVSEILPRKNIVDDKNTLPFSKAPSPTPKPKPGRDFRTLQMATLREFKEWTSALKNTGFRPAYVALHAGSEEPRFNSIAVDDGKRDPWEIIFPEADIVPFFQDKHQVLSFRYALGGKIHEGSVWVNQAYSPSGIPIETGLGKSWWGRTGGFSFVNSEIQRTKSSGWRPVHFTRDQILPNDSLTCTFGRDGGVAWDTRLNISPEALHEHLKLQRNRKWMPQLMHIVSSDNGFQFLLVFVENTAMVPWDWHGNLSADQLATQLASQKKNGLHPLSIASYGNLDSPRFAVLWRQPQAND